MSKKRKKRLKAIKSEVEKAQNHLRIASELCLAAELPTSAREFLGTADVCELDLETLGEEAKEEGEEERG